MIALGFAPWPEAYLPVLIPLLAVGIWLLSSRLTGWANLAEVYTASGACSGEQWHFQSAALRWWTHYGNCLTVGADAQGLWISVFFLFRLGHPNLMIPWSEVSATKVDGLFGRYVELRFQRVPGVPFRITERLAGRLAPFLSRSGTPFFDSGRQRTRLN